MTILLAKLPEAYALLLIVDVLPVIPVLFLLLALFGKRRLVFVKAVI
jgi:hypothetical protein